MKIVHQITRFIRGGADENTLLTCNGQAALGHEVHLVVGREYHPAIVARIDPRVQFHVMPSLQREVSPYHDLAALYDSVALFRKIGPDIVHTHESKAGIIGRIAARMAGVKTIVHGVHILPFIGVSAPKRMLYLGLERAAARYTDVFIDVSEGMKQECLSAGLGSEETHHIVASGMDVSKYRDAQPPEDWHELIDPALIAPSVGEEPRFLLIAGAFEERKRIPEFLAVFARIAARVPEAVLLIAGDGPERPRIEATIAQLGLEGRVVLAGHREDLEQLIALSDACVHAAMREGLPRVTVQYVMVGRPLVATHLPGLDRIVSDGDNGYLVPPDDLDAMEDPLVALLTDQDLQDRHVAAARAIDISEWDADHMVHRIEHIYRTIRS